MVTEPTDQVPVRYRGRWNKGESGNPAGRQRGKTIREVMKEALPPEEWAKAFLKLCLKPGRDQRQALEYVMNQLEGSPRQTLAVQHDGESPLLLAMASFGALLAAAKQEPAPGADVRLLEST